MKKLNLVLLTIFMIALLVGCGKTTKVTNNDVTTLELSVATPSGAPAIAFYAHLLEDNLEVNSVAQNVVAYLTSSSTKDVVVAPTNAGIQAIVNKGATFKLAAVITFGNFFIVSCGTDSDNTLNEGDKVLAFQETNVAGKLFQYVYGDKGLDVEYLSDLQAVKTKVLTQESEEYDYLLLAQPVVSAILNQKSNYSVYANVQDDYKTKTGGKSITQASIFVKDGLDKAKVNSFLSMIKNDIETLKNNPNVLVEKTNDVTDEAFAAKISGTKALIKNLITNNNQIGIGFEYAYEYKASIDAFIATLGMNATNEEIYWRTQE